MRAAFQRNKHIAFEYSDGEVLGVTTNPVTIAYSYDLYFSEESNVRPKQGDIDQLVSTALSEPASKILVQRLSTLQNGNPFSQTTVVEYSLDFNGGGEDTTVEAEVPSSAIALLVVGIFLGALGLGMILIRRRRFQRHRRRVHPEEADELLSHEQPTTLSDWDPDQAAALSTGSSSLIDVKWSMPSGHDGTFEPRSTVDTQSVKGVQQPDLNQRDLANTRGEG